MGFISLEHSPAAYRADFLIYGAAISLLALTLLIAAPRADALVLGLGALLGLASWSGIEYVLHRFVLHGVPPFCHWHAMHHARPSALIGAPTVLSAALIFGLVFLPAWGLSNAWLASALTLGVMAGYLAFGLTHHATHHGRTRNPWLARRKRWHALHHHHVKQPDCYGVTSNFWDHLCGSAASAR